MQRLELLALILCTVYWQVDSVLHSLDQTAFPYIKISLAKKAVVWNDGSIATKFAVSEAVIISSKVI
jgi:hypothetical protein